MIVVCRNAGKALRQATFQVALAKLNFQIQFCTTLIAMDMDKFQKKFVTKSKILCRNKNVSTNHNHYNIKLQGENL